MYGKYGKQLRCPNTYGKYGTLKNKIKIACGLLLLWLAL